MSEQIATLEDFERACVHHDLTYEYSDDGETWRRGGAQLYRIQEAAKKLPREDVERIWNAVVDTKLVPDARANFYWKWPKATDGGTP